VTDYGRNKSKIEDILLSANGKNGLHTTVIRPSYTTGEGAEYPGLLFDNSLPNRLKQGLPVIVMDDGKAAWAVAHVSDVGRAFVNSLMNPKLTDGLITPPAMSTPPGMGSMKLWQKPWEENSIRFIYRRMALFQRAPAKPGREVHLPIPFHFRQLQGETGPGSRPPFPSRKPGAGSSSGWNKPERPRRLRQTDSKT